jgi:signal transduction histidine kinase
VPSEKPRFTALRSKWKVAPRIVPYALTAIVIAATVPVVSILPLSHTRSAFFLLVVLASSWYAGLGPGLFASVLSVLALNFFFFSPHLSFAVTSEDFVELILFSLVAALTTKLVAQWRKTSNALAVLNVDLEQRVNGRTAELKQANERLQDEIEARSRMQQELARSNGELKQFAYVFSHDVLVPVRTIAASAAELKQPRSRSDAETIELADQIRLTAEHIESFISGALSFARLNSERRIAAEEISMEATLQWALLNLKTAIEQSGAAVTHDSLPAVRGDQAQIASLLQNLISNAIKYRRGEPPCVHVSAREMNGAWVFAVADNGIGIPPEFHESIFEMFQRLPSGPERAGSGLGLAICRKIVENHGGRIWLESQPGAGSTFYFTLEESDPRAGGSDESAGAAFRRPVQSAVSHSLTSAGARFTVSYQPP